MFKNEPLFELKIDAEISSYLNHSARWAKFLAIVGMVFCGIMLILAAASGKLVEIYMPAATPEMTSVLTTVFTVVYIVSAIIWFFPFLYLLNFANKMQRALRLVDQAELALAFRNLKSSYRYVGVVTIIILGLYALLFILGIASDAIVSR